MSTSTEWILNLNDLTLNLNEKYLTPYSSGSSLVHLFILVKL